MSVVHLAPIAAFALLLSLPGLAEPQLRISSATLDATRVPAGEAANVEVRVLNSGRKDIGPIEVAVNQPWAGEKRRETARVGTNTYRIAMRPTTTGTYKIRVNIAEPGRETIAADAGLLEVIDSPSRWTAIKDLVP